MFSQWHSTTLLKHTKCYFSLSLTQKHGDTQQCNRLRKGCATQKKYENRQSMSFIIKKLLAILHVNRGSAVYV